MRSLGIVQSPLQLLNVAEACLQDGVHPHMLVVWEDQATCEQLRRLANQTGLTDVRFQRRTPLFRLFAPILLSWWYRRHRSKVDRLYFGTFTSWAAWLVNWVRPRSLIMVDDGQKTINVIRAPHLVGLPGAWYARGPFSKAFVMRAELFTFYEETARRAGRVTRSNRLDKVSQLVHSLGSGVRSVEPDSILFIGTNISTSYRYFARDMGVIQSAARGKRLIYLSHRRDDPALIKQLSLALGFEVVQSQLPLELVFSGLWRANKPDVWTFGSTATDTLQAMYPELKVTVFKVQVDGFHSPRLGAAFASIYQHYSQLDNVKLLAIEQVTST